MRAQTTNSQKAYHERSQFGSTLNKTSMAEETGKSDSSVETSTTLSCTPGGELRTLILAFVSSDIFLIIPPLCSITTPTL
jgi:hypothetical protein